MNEVHIFAFIFNSDNKIYLDSVDIHTIYSLAKLAHWYLRLYTMER